MSKMKDLWGDTIVVLAEDDHVYISFSESRLYDDSEFSSMELDADLARKLIKKLKKAIAEVEDV